MLLGIESRRAFPRNFLGNNLLLPGSSWKQRPKRPGRLEAPAERRVEARQARMYAGMSYRSLLGGFLVGWGKGQRGLANLSTLMGGTDMLK